VDVGVGLGVGPVVQRLEPRGHGTQLPDENELRRRRLP
jgi:hypothetical protein